MPLLVRIGDQTQVFHDRFTVGRKNADLVIDDEYASPLHAAFYPDGDRWYAEDLGSTNGTWVRGYTPDGRHVYGPQELNMGDQVKIGHTVLTVVPA